jgi:hypothetical protein
LYQSDIISAFLVAAVPQLLSTCGEAAKNTCLRGSAAKQRQRKMRFDTTPLHFSQNLSPYQLFLYFQAAAVPQLLLLGF